MPHDAFDDIAERFHSQSARDDFRAALQASRAELMASVHRIADTAVSEGYPEMVPALLGCLLAAPTQADVDRHADEFLEAEDPRAVADEFAGRLFRDLQTAVSRVLAGEGWVSDAS